MAKLHHSNLPGVKAATAVHCDPSGRASLPSQFVILHHTIGDCEHWDLMFEEEDSLATWRLDRDPTLASAFPMKGVRIANHRKLYLRYEGAVSGGRGDVRRVDGGPALILERGVDQFTVKATGERLRGRLNLSLVSGDEWEISMDDAGFETGRFAP